MSDFEVSRSTRVEAPPERVYALVNDFHQWRAWSPWEDVDPDLHRNYTGPPAGVGAHYDWSGNRKAGAGSMEITGSTPREVDIALHFVKPFKADNQVVFELVPTGAGTEVTWRMTGTNKGVWSLVSKVMPMDRMVGKDFEKGLSRLKATAEQG